MIPKVISFTPAWLSKGSPGHNLFAPPKEHASRTTFPPSSKTKKAPVSGPRRTIARRGTEIFVANGKEVRWGDVVYLKERHTERRRGTPRIKRESSIGLEDGAAPDWDGADGFRVMKTPVADDIKQLVISPNGTYLAILTNHTAHILLIPESSFLTSREPLRPTIWTLGPTTHVTSRPAIASALWHPLGVNGSCLVTITKDAVIRVWELSQSDRWSFDSPTLAIDLKRLADGTSLDQDFSASTSATTAAFSPDSFEMEVASACFGSRSSGGWNPFTLWIAMREGDVYCLCPLLPSHWAPPRALIASLSVSIVANIGAIEDDPAVSEQHKLLAQQQLAWMGEIDSQEPQIVDGAVGDPPTEIYTRPSKPGVVPRLQGPFVLDARAVEENDMDSELTDILVIGSRVEADQLLDQDTEYVLEDADTECMSLTLICLLSTSGQVKICIDLDGVEAQWLPSKQQSKLARLQAQGELPSLLLYSAMNSMTESESNPEAWPLFSTDVISKYNFYVTHHAGITYFSLTPWVFRLDSEIENSGVGAEFRIGLLVNSHNSLRERIHTQKQADISAPLAACNALSDPDIGHAIISATPYDAVALIFATPEEDYPLIKRETPSPTPFEEESRAPEPLYTYEPRPSFQVSHVFDQNSLLPTLIERLRTSKHRVIMGQELRLSPLTLQVLTEAHKILSDETHKLGVAASDLIIKCDRMRPEMQEQLQKAAETKARIDKIVGNVYGAEGSDDARIAARITKAQDRQHELTDRLESLRKAVARATKQELSPKEVVWMDEVKDLEARMLGSPEGRDSSGQMKQRLEAATNLAWDLIDQAKKIIKDGEGEERVGSPERKGSPARGHRATSSQDLRVPHEIRKRKFQEVRGLLAREEAMVQSVSSRLEKLQLSVP